MEPHQDAHGTLRDHVGIQALRRARHYALRIGMSGLLACMAISTGDCAPPAAQHPSAIKIVLVGDSTTAQGSGWGGAFCDLHVAGMVACLPMGRGGRSTKTYRAEGSWQLVQNEIKVSGYDKTYVLIEMGHNDKNQDPAIGTKLDTEFPANLEQFVSDVRAAGAVPILVTPLSARHFRGGALYDSIAPWAQSVRSVAGHMGVAMIDLNTASEKLYSEMGSVRTLTFETRSPTPEEVRAAEQGTTSPARVGDGLPVSAAVPAGDPRRHYSDDYIHLNATGANMISGLVAKLLVNAQPALSRFVKP